MSRSACVGEADSTPGRPARLVICETGRPRSRGPIPPRTRVQRPWPRGEEAAGRAVYGRGLIGALVPYWQHAHRCWAHVWAVAEAIPWPAFVTYHLPGHIPT
jgi:hypothetical protein